MQAASRSRGRGRRAQEPAAPRARQRLLAAGLLAAFAMRAAAQHPEAGHAILPPPGAAVKSPRQLLAPAASEGEARHANAIMLGTSAALAVYGRSQWWRDGFRNRFTATSEGWFGPDTYSGGADKLGHFYMTYASARLLTRVFVWDGAGRARALRTAAWYTLGAYAAIEVLDGFSRQWRFSHEDMLMNAAGVGAAAMLELNPELDRKLDLRLLYLPSRENGRRFDPFGDYSGQTYLIVTRLAGFDAVPQTSWLRFVEVAAGYGTRGFERESGRRGNRKLYFGVSLNLSELLARPESAKARWAQSGARTMLEFIQVPATAVLVHHTLHPGAVDAPPESRPGQR